MITRQFMRYAVVGVAHNLAGFLLYLLATSWGVEPKLAMSFTFLLSVAASFALNRAWSFEHAGPASRSFARYCAVYLSCYVLNLLALWVFYDRLGFAHQWVQGLAMITIAVLSFLINRYFVFSASPTARNT